MLMWYFASPPDLRGLEPGQDPAAPPWEFLAALLTSGSLLDRPRQQLLKFLLSVFVECF